MQKKPGITALHPAGDARIALFVTDVVGPRGQANRDSVWAGRNWPPQIGRLTHRSRGDVLVHSNRLTFRQPRPSSSVSLGPDQSVQLTAVSCGNALRYAFDISRRIRSRNSE